MLTIVGLAALLLTSPSGLLIVLVILVFALSRLFRNGTLTLNPAWRRRPPGGALAHQARFPFGIIGVALALLAWEAPSLVVRGIVASLFGLYFLLRYRRRGGRERGIAELVGLTPEPERTDDLVGELPDELEDFEAVVGRPDSELVIDLHPRGHGPNRRWE